MVPLQNYLIMLGAIRLLRKWGENLEKKRGRNGRHNRFGRRRARDPTGKFTTSRSGRLWASVRQSAIRTWISSPTTRTSWLATPSLGLGLSHHAPSQTRNRQACQGQ